MTSEQRLRLEKFVKFLRNLPKANFNIRIWTDFEGGSGNAPREACAIGWLPVLFPEDWFYDDGIPLLKENCLRNMWHDGTEMLDPVFDAETYFGLDHSIASELFVGLDLTARTIADRLAARVL